MKNIYKYLSVIILIFLFIYSIINLFNKISIKYFDYQYLSNLYYNSQYNQGYLTISDSDLYSFAGYTYLTTGKLDKINIEHPPLGKYLIGVSILLTHSTVAFQLLFAILLILAISMLTFQISKNVYLTLLAAILFLSDKLFSNGVLVPEFDVPITALIILYICFSNFKNINYRILIMGILLGLISGIKYPTGAIILYLSTIAYFYITKEKMLIKKITLIGLISVFIFIAQYTPLIATNGFGDLIKIQYKALKIHLSHVPNYPPFAASKVMLLNQWPSWWDKIKPIYAVEEWSLFWPFLWIATICSPILMFKKQNLPTLLTVIFLLFYFIFINTRLFFPHYLLPITSITYPLLIIEIYQLSQYMYNKIYKAIRL